MRGSDIPSLELLTPFVGRGADLERIGVLFRERRLITLWGPAGIGKTRLAVEYASRFAGESLFVDLSSARCLGTVCETVASALDVVLPGGRESDQAPVRLGRVLAARGPILLVLDNFERIAHLAVETVGRWLREAPEVRFLLGSRERLRLRGEGILELGPLSLPADAAFAASEAVQLFLLKARAEDDAFELTDENAPRIAELVQKLEGIPLAIELAAVRLPLLGVDGLISRLGKRLDVLCGGFRDAEPRQATLRTALEWSWDLLTEEDQRALVECSLFPGAFSFSSAEAVLSAKDVLSRLESLRGKSLLRVLGTGKLGLFECVRELLDEHYAQIDPELHAEARHTAHFLTLALGRHEQSPDEPLDAELRDNVVAALKRELGRLERSPSGEHRPRAGPAPERAVRALLAIEPALARRGPADLLLELLERALHLAPDLPPALGAPLFAARGRAAQVRGHVDEARSRFDQGIELAEASGLFAIQAAIVTDLGVLHHEQRELSEARACYDLAMSRLAGQGDRRAEGRLLANLGALLHDLRQYEAARERYQDALRVLGDAGVVRLQGIVQVNLGVLEQEQGDLGTALVHYEFGLRLLERAGDRRLEAIALGNLGTLQHERSQLASARGYHERALLALRTTGDVRSETLARGRLAMVLAALGDLTTSRGLLAEAELAVTSGGDALAAAFVDLAWGAAELCAAEALEANEPQEARALLQRVRQRMERAHRASAPGGPSPAELSDDVRIGLRILSAALGRLSAEAAEELSADALVIAPSAGCYRPPGGEWEDLRQHPVLRRILFALVEQRRARPGVGLSLEEIQRAAWPGERIRTDAAANRIYVAVSKLRRRGLRDFLRSQDDGYALDPNLEVQRFDGATPGANPTEGAS
ncbi:tetratricopeptide repeat protein [Polyangium spumosum]|uniref:tetratricopeptide repeat protein n=1 Tax=Polyangium spumosum TaxID=889282 RepID=UPI00129A83F2